MQEKEPGKDDPGQLRHPDLPAGQIGPPSCGGDRGGNRLPEKAGIYHLRGTPGDPPHPDVSAYKE